MRIGRQRKWSWVCAAEMPPGQPTGLMSVLPGYDMQRSLSTLIPKQWLVSNAMGYPFNRSKAHIYLKSAHIALVLVAPWFAPNQTYPCEHSWVITYRTMHKSIALYVTIWHKLGCSRVSQCTQSHVSNTVTRFIVSLVSYVFGTLWQAIR